MHADKLRVVGRLLAERLHISGTAISESDRDVVRFRDIDEIKAQLKRQLSNFPLALLKKWDCDPSGHIVVMAKLPDSGHPGRYLRTTTKAIELTTEAIWNNRGVPEEEVTHLLDHFLGSPEKDPSKTLSCGHSVDERLLPFAQRIFELSRDPENYVNNYCA